MKISFHSYPTGWPYSAISWLKYKKLKYKISASNALMTGMRLHGDEPFIGSKRKPVSSDVAVLWSWKQPNIIVDAHRKNRQILVMERGFIQPRNDWVSLSLNGFNNRGSFAPAPDNGERWDNLFSSHLKPWRYDGEYTLLIGQVPGDAALNGVDNVKWVQEIAAELINMGKRVKFRPHPLAPTPCPKGAILSSSTLHEDLSKAESVVAFSSTTAVESILAGIPTVVYDVGSIAYPMCSHKITDPLIRPDRTQWCHNIAWRQWTYDELRNGKAWAHTRTLVKF